VQQLSLESEHGRAVAVTVERMDDLAPAVAALDLGTPRPAVVVVGGAAGLDGGSAGDLPPLAAGIVRAAESCGAAIVDGGTDSGVMRLVGEARAQDGVSTPLVGVVVRALAGLPGNPLTGAMAALEPRHTHFVLVPGSEWGQEAPWIATVAGTIARGRPSVTVLINGGEIAWSDVAASVGAGRRVLAVAGTGRTADLVAAAATEGPHDERSAMLVATGLVEAVASGAGAGEALARRIEGVLATEGSVDAG
jgi:hypothetical protein